MGEYQEQSLRGRVFHSIRDGILKGKYQEHEELREVTLGKELGEKLNQNPDTESSH